MNEEHLAPGDAVVVPWGLDEVNGVVERLIQRGVKTSVDVLVTLPGDEEAESVNFPVDAVRKALLDEGEGASEIGDWLDAFHYQESLFAVFANILDRYSTKGVLGREAVSNFHIAGGRTDIETWLNDGSVLIVEAKKVRSVNRRLVEDAVEQLNRWAEQQSSSASLVRGLIVFSEEIGTAYNDPATAPFRVGNRSVLIRLTSWRSEADNSRLEEAVNALVAA